MITLPRIGRWDSLKALEDGQTWRTLLSWLQGVTSTLTGGLTLGNTAWTVSSATVVPNTTTATWSITTTQRPTGCLLLCAQTSAGVGVTGTFAWSQQGGSIACSLTGVTAGVTYTFRVLLLE